MKTPAAADRAAALALFPLDPETERRLAIYAELLLKWQKTINLVAKSTLPHVWTRHFADSLQVHAAVGRSCGDCETRTTRQGAVIESDNPSG